MLLFNKVYKRDSFLPQCCVIYIEDFTIEIKLEMNYGEKAFTKLAGGGFN